MSTKTIEEAAQKRWGAPFPPPAYTDGFSDGASYALDGEVSDEVRKVALKVLVNPLLTLRGIIAAVFAARKKELGI